MDSQGCSPDGHTGSARNPNWVMLTMRKHWLQVHSSERGGATETVFDWLEAFSSSSSSSSLAAMRSRRISSRSASTSLG